MEYGIWVKDGKLFENHKLLEDDFVKTKCIGEGAFSKVYLVKKQGSGEYFAMKKMSKKYVLDHQTSDKIMNERKLLSRLHHPYIIHLHYAFQTKTHLFLIFDFINGGDLFFLLQQYKKRRFPEGQARFYAAQLFLALQYVHKSGAIYRDLKPENVLLGPDGNLKLADFGLCKIVAKKFRRKRKNKLRERGLTNTLVGTPAYFSPEQLKGLIHLEKKIITKKGFDRMVDWWAFGVVLHEMLTGRHPFDESGRLRNNINRLLDQVERRPFMFNSRKYPRISRSAINLLSRLFVKEPKKRIGYRNDNDIRNHPFFKSINWDEMESKSCVPPFIPKIRGPGDTSFFDHEESKSQKKKDRLENDPNQITRRDQKRFIGYSFACDSWVEGEEKEEEFGEEEIERVIREILEDDQDEDEGMEGVSSSVPSKSMKKKKKKKCEHHHHDDEMDNLKNKKKQVNPVLLMTNDYTKRTEKRKEERSDEEDVSKLISNIAVKVTRKSKKSPFYVQKKKKKTVIRRRVKNSPKRRLKTKRGITTTTTPSKQATTTSPSQKRKKRRKKKKILKSAI